MNKKPPYPGMTNKEYERLLKTSRHLSSFAGDDYVKMHKNTIAEIQEQHRRNDKKLAMDQEIIGKPLIRIRNKKIK